MHESISKNGSVDIHIYILKYTPLVRGWSTIIRGRGRGIRSFIYNLYIYVYLRSLEIWTRRSSTRRIYTEFPWTSISNISLFFSFFFFCFLRRLLDVMRIERGFFVPIEQNDSFCPLFGPISNYNINDKGIINVYAK